MKKIVSFGVWGKKPLYTEGLLQNAKLMPTVYPGWIMRAYVASNVPGKIVKELEEMDHVEVVKMGKNEGIAGMFWRWLPAEEDDVLCFISRDADSRINMREKLAVDEWLASKKAVHIMRDHAAHVFPMMGGMWGARGHDLRNRFDFSVKDFLAALEMDKTEYLHDQYFLSNMLFPKLTDGDYMCHDEVKKAIPTALFPNCSPFPVNSALASVLHEGKDYPRFVGQRISEKGESEIMEGVYV